MCFSSHFTNQLTEACHAGGPVSIPGQSVWDLWRTKWHWDRFFPEYFGFPLSISFHRCSITRKKHIIFITGLHNKPQGCGASVASAAGPFTTHKKKQLTEFGPLFIKRRRASIAQSVYRLDTGCTFQVSNPGGGEIFLTRPDRL